MKMDKNFHSVLYLERSERDGYKNENSCEKYQLFREEDDHEY